MKTYVDANVLIRLYLDLGESREAMQLVSLSDVVDDYPIPVTKLLEIEVMNGLHRMAFESRNGGPWRIPIDAAGVALLEFERHIDDETFLRRSPLTLRDIEFDVRSLIERFTAREGFRTYDVMHVASALALGCQQFLTFDQKARKLAQLAGLKTN